MKIAVIGAGAMGSIYGAMLSSACEVYIIDKNKEVVETVKANGLKIEYEGKVKHYYPKITDDANKVGKVDLIILFVKSTSSKVALESNKELIGSDTKIMTLQNGAGHEDLLKEFVNRDRIIIGTTEDNGSVVEPGYVKRGGTGVTNIGLISKDKTDTLDKIRDIFNKSGFNVKIHSNIKKLIWDKLFINTSLSVVTAILQVDMGYIYSNKYAWNMTRKLIHEANITANAMGLKFKEEDIIEKVKLTSINNPKGYTSLRSDIENNRKTEVETISGAVIKEAKNNGIEVPIHEFVVNMIHAMENK